MKHNIDLALRHLWVCPDGRWRFIDYLAFDYVTFDGSETAGNCGHRAFRRWIARNKAAPGRVVPVEDAQ